MKDQRGIGMIEAMISVALVGLIAFAALNGIVSMTSLQRRGASIASLSGIRLNLQNMIHNDSVWAAIVQHPSNAGRFTCLVDAAGNPGCSPTAAPVAFDVVDASGDIIYAPASSPSAGFTADGAVCDEFTEEGNTSCVVRVELTWRPICPGGGEPCTRPTVRVEARFEVKNVASLGHIAVNTRKLDFSVLRHMAMCSATHVPVSDMSQWNGNANAQPNVPFGGIVSGNPTSYDPDLFATPISLMNPCGRQRFDFVQSVHIAPSAGVTDAANAASVCVSRADPPRSCVFEWRQTGASWSLWRRSANGVFDQVYVMPPDWTLSETTRFTFEIDQGRVKFYVDGALTYFFDRALLDRAYSLRITPPPANYSRGIQIFE